MYEAREILYETRQAGDWIGAGSKRTWMEHIAHHRQENYEHASSTRGAFNEVTVAQPSDIECAKKCSLRRPYVPVFD
jgi:hypothetical protein